MASKGETKVVNNIKKFLRDNLGDKVFFFKVNGSGFQKSGVPDLIVCIEGRFLGLEVKDPKNTKYGVTDLQAQRIKEIKKAGGIAEVVYGPEDVEKILISHNLIDRRIINLNGKIISTSKEGSKSPKRKKDVRPTNGAGNGKNSSNDKKIRKTNKTKKD